MKKLNKFFAILVSLAMMATLCVCMAFAEPVTPGSAQDGQVATANIVKYFQIPEGVTVPSNKTFNYTFTKISDSAKEDTNSMPPLDAFTITADNETNANDDGQSLYGTKPFSEILAGKTFDHAGVYTYRVDETDGLDEDITYDQSTYLIHIYVENKADGSGTEVTHITGEEEVWENDEPTGTGTGEKEKMDVEDPVVIEDADEDGEPDEDGDADRDEHGSIVTEGVTFTNTLKEDNTGTIVPQNGDLGALGVQKKLAAVKDEAKLAEFANTEFPFTIELTAATGREAETLTAYVYDKDGNKTATKYEFTGATSSADFNLKQGESLIFETAPVGTKWTVKERLSDCTNAKKDKFNPSFEAVNGATTASGTEVAGADLETAEYLIHQVEVTENETTVNKEVNKATYTNTFDDELDTPTGILISNLPYIALALVAIGGLVAYVVVRRRDENA